MYTLAWGLAHRQLQQDSWSRTDRSLWEGPHFFPGCLSLYAVVAGDAGFSGCWWSRLLVTRMSGKLSLKTLPRHESVCGKKQDGWKKASSGGEDEHILVWDPRSVTQENRENIPAPPGVADVTRSGFLPAETFSCLDILFKKQIIYFLLFVFSARNVMIQKGRAFYKNIYIYNLTKRTAYEKKQNLWGAWVDSLSV